MRGLYESVYKTLRAKYNKRQVKFLATRDENNQTFLKKVGMKGARQVLCQPLK